MTYSLPIADSTVAPQISAAPPPSPTTLPPPPPPTPSRIASLRVMLFEHAFVPLALSALLCFAFWFTRVILTRTPTYDFLIKNLFLAWLPYFFSLAAVWMKRSPRPRSKWSIAAVWAAWLVTFPNAPYIFTDLIHWRDRPRVMPWWFDLGVVLMFGLAGCFAGIVSLRIMHDVIRGAIGSIGGWAFVTAVALLSGFGIYLGRFDRWNSWDLFIQPHRVITQTLYRSLGPQLVDRTFGVTLMFGAMIFVTYVMFVSMASKPPMTRTEPAR
jgi:uncharacterized membrane protein